MKSALANRAVYRLDDTFETTQNLHHVNMPSCGMKGIWMEAIKIVGKSGQISLGRSLAGKGFVLEVLATGDILLRRSVNVPANEHWRHTPAMQNKLAKADTWMDRNMAKETPIAAIVRKRAVVRRGDHL